MPIKTPIIALFIATITITGNALALTSYQYQGSIEGLIKDMMPIKQDIQKHSFIAQGRNPFEPIDIENVTITLNPTTPHAEIDRILKTTSQDIDKYYVKPAIYRPEYSPIEQLSQPKNSVVIVNSSVGYSAYPIRALSNKEVESTIIQAYPELFSNKAELKIAVGILEDYYTQFTLIHELAHGSDFTDTPQTLTYYSKDKYILIAEMIADVAALLTINAQSDITTPDFETLISGLIAFRSSDLWLYETDKSGSRVIKAQRPKHATTPALSTLLKAYRADPGFFKSLSYKDIAAIAYNTAIRTSRYALSMNDLEMVVGIERIQKNDLTARIKAIKSQYIY